MTQVGLHPTANVVTDRGGEGTGTGKAAEDGGRAWSHERRTCLEPPGGRGSQEGGFSRALGTEALPPPGFQTSDLQKSERLHFCSGEPPSCGESLQQPEGTTTRHNGKSWRKDSEQRK